MTMRHEPDCPLCGMKFGADAGDDRGPRDGDDDRRRRALEARLQALEREESPRRSFRGADLCGTCERTIPAASGDDGALLPGIRSEIQRLREKRS